MLHLAVNSITFVQCRGFFCPRHGQPLPTTQKCIPSMKNQAADILKRSNMSVTASRQQILHLFFDQPEGALRHSDIEKSLAHLDRVTIYRTLQVFTEKGLIHSIPGSDGVTRYALCHHGQCQEGHHHDNHVHFYCNACGNTRCLNEVAIPQVQLPAHLQVSGIEMLINGTCEACLRQVQVQ